MAGRPPIKPDPKSPEEQFGARLRAMREAAEIRAEDAAVKLNISASTLWDYERGRRDPRPRTLINMAAIYRCSIDNLFMERNTDEQSRNH